LSTKHYENFPVASLALPRKFRMPVGLIYSFARQADDFADEGDLSDQARLSLLDGFRHKLERIENGKAPESQLFAELAVIIDQHRLPLKPFHDLLDAFCQDVTKKRYANFGEVLAYCEKSANPVGRLLLALYGFDTEECRTMSDRICTSLQLINFLQDVSIDYHRLGRIYLPRDEMESCGISEEDIAAGNAGQAWSKFMMLQANRARKMMLEGAPLARIMKGRISFEMKMIVQGGLAILDKLEKVEWDVYKKRPKLEKPDWIFLAMRALHG
jgi:squalene synthase HpnC